MKPFRFTNLVWVALSASLGLTGCAGTGVTTASGPGIRAVNGLPSVAQAVVLDGATILSSSLPYAGVSGTPNTPYAIVTLGSQSVSFANVNAPTTILSTNSVSVPNVGLHFDEVFYNATKPTCLTLVDNFNIPNTAAIRFANASTTTGAVDIIVTPPAGAGTSPVFSLSPGQVGPTQPVGSFAYQQFTVTGAYFVQVFPAGHDTGTPLVQETINLTVGTTFSFILLDPAVGTTTPVLLQVQDSQLYDTGA